MGKCEYCVREPYKAPPANHTSADYTKTMPRFVFCKVGDFPVTPIQVVVHHVKAVPPDYSFHAEFHYQDMDQVYILASEEEGTLAARLNFEDEVYEVKLPAAILFPKGVHHKYAVKSGHDAVFYPSADGNRGYVAGAEGRTFSQHYRETGR